MRWLKIDVEIPFSIDISPLWGVERSGIGINRMNAMNQRYEPLYQRYE